MGLIINKIKKTDPYRSTLEEMDNETLGYVFADKVGDELREFEHLMFHYGREFVIDYLCDLEEVEAFNDL